jgi:hypothetical protein
MAEIIVVVVLLLALPLSAAIGKHITHGSQWLFGVKSNPPQPFEHRGNFRRPVGFDEERAESARKLAEYQSHR